MQDNNQHDVFGKDFSVVSHTDIMNSPSLSSMLTLVKVGIEILVRVAEVVRLAVKVSVNSYTSSSATEMLKQTLLLLGLNVSLTIGES